ncbi:MAG: hypothetical protein KDA52_21860, partial [Planctomycetaceae bacterium]|nr:hypothetical protein [Planctomycetaceae bacterium]
LAAEGDSAFQWSPVYGRVDGTLPLDQLPVLNVGGRQMSFVRFRVTADQPQLATTLSFNQTRGLTGWLNGKPVALAEVVPVELESGENWMTLAVSADARANDLKITLDTTTPEVRLAP